MDLAVYSNSPGDTDVAGKPKGKEEPEYETINVTIAADAARWLRGASALTGQTMARLVEDFCKAGLERLEREAKQKFPRIAPQPKRSFKS